MLDDAGHASRITATRFLTQGLGSAGFIAAGTLDSIVGASLSSSRAWAEVPADVVLLEVPLAALGWGHLFGAMGLIGTEDPPAP